MGGKLSKEEIIKALLDASFFRSTGATSLADIADLLKVKKASLYNHFESRDDIVAQTMDFCAQYIRSINFAPDDIEGVAQKYSAETVLKGIVNRYFKMHEKSPLFQIYTFIESQKYFFKIASDVVKEESEKLISQTMEVFSALYKNNKLKIPSFKMQMYATWFCSGVREQLSLYLMPKKQQIMENPASGEGELFALPQDQGALDEIDSLVEHFASIIS